MVAIIFGVAVGCGAPTREATSPALGGTTFVEELRVGVGEGPDEYMLGKIEHLAVSPNGTIYAADEQVGTVRIYGADGVHRGDAGRIGEGPGEYRMMKGLQALPDGRLALLDPGRVRLFAADGDPAGGFAAGNGSWTGRQDLEVDDSGRLLVATTIVPDNPSANARRVYSVYESTGKHVASIDIPRPDTRTRARVPPNSSGVPLYFGLMTAGRPLLPFTVAEIRAWSPRGYFLIGSNDAYEIEARIGERVLFTLGRTVPQTPIRGAELDEWQAIAQFLRADRAAKHGIRSGPAVFPSAKPFFRDVYTGREGRIWVWRYVDAHKSAPLPDYEGSGRPALTWREPPTFDGFDSDGEYLGSVVLPVGFDPMVWRGDQVWGVHEDEAGVRYILRLGLVPNQEPGPQGG